MQLGSAASGGSVDGGAVQLLPVVNHVAVCMAEGGIYEFEPWKYFALDPGILFFAAAPTATGFVAATTKAASPLLRGKEQRQDGELEGLWLAQQHSDFPAHDE
ncbi:hypothetical protein JKP88DRAFT_287061 [Tribonema minus]|uniref:Uncharacterized protein n=1 Tax=Tribonema minus TaxID=303371 RepID=A0A836CMN8_9STRA|nr:hypothetical protein JKP88DRAFT_287061 [Tribonema minus]